MQAGHAVEKMKPSDRKKDREIYSNHNSKKGKKRRIRKRDSEE